jgi:membrane protein
MSYISKIFDLLKQTFAEWRDDDVPVLAAALSYYTAFSIAPLLIVLIAVVGLFFGEEAARGQIVTQLTSELGRDNAEFIQEIVQNANQEGESGIVATIVGLVALLIGASGVFEQLHNTLNRVWGIVETPQGFGNLVRRRLLSFGMILVIGFLLLVSLVVSSVIASLDAFIVGIVPSVQLVMQLVSFVISFGIVTLLFAMIYKYLPDAEIAWRDVLVGAAFTSLLFNIGRWLLAIYLARTSTASSYGAAGSLAVLLLWVYYSAQIILFGAEFTQVYASKYGTLIASEVAARKEVTQDDKVTSQPLAHESETSRLQQPRVVIRRNYEGWNPRYVFVAATALIGGIIGLTSTNENKADTPDIEQAGMDESSRTSLTILSGAILTASTLFSGLVGWFLGRNRNED